MDHLKIWEWPGDKDRQLLLLLVDFTYPLYNRQYEEKQLKGQQAREEKKLEFANLQQRLQNQLEFEKQKNPASVFVYRCVCMCVWCCCAAPAIVRKYARTIGADEKSVTELKREEKEKEKVS